MSTHRAAAAGFRRGKGALAALFACVVWLAYPAPPDRELVVDVSDTADHCADYCDTCRPTSLSACDACDCPRRASPASGGGVRDGGGQHAGMVDPSGAARPFSWGRP